MNKKVLIIVGMAAVIAVSGGVVSYLGTGSHERGADADPTSVYTESAAVTDPDDVTEEAETEETAEALTEPDTVSHEERDDRGYKSALTSSYLHVSRVKDHTDNDEYTPREIFGSMYTNCYLLFNADGSFEVCLNPALGEVREGSYKIFGDVISVTYDDGKGAEFDIIPSSGSGFEYIVVSYGDYDVYFS